MASSGRRGETVDILLDVSNPGVWMAHCHIAEHHESGMMFNFHVDPRNASPVEPVPSDAAPDVPSMSVRELSGEPQNLPVIRHRQGSRDHDLRELARF